MARRYAPTASAVATSRPSLASMSNDMMILSNCIVGDATSSFDIQFVAEQKHYSVYIVKILR